jgi:hypothetical protein
VTVQADTVALFDDDFTPNDGSDLRRSDHLERELVI